MADEQSEASMDGDAEAPPLGSWKRVYVLVISVLVVELVLFWLFTVTFE